MVHGNVIDNGIMAELNKNACGLDEHEKSLLAFNLCATKCSQNT